jgi:hypothetical protein
LDRHFERYAIVHSERYEPRHGPLRPVVRRVVEQYLDCGRLQNGFARLRCAACRADHLLAFSCQTRNFCPSCQAKRAAVFAERVREEIVLPVPHRHVTFTIPRALRGLFERDRRLLSLLARCAYAAIRRAYQAHFRRADAVPGMIVSIQTFGSYANFHPHVHALVTDGVVTPDGAFLPLLEPDVAAIAELFRRLLLAELRAAERLSEAFHARLLGWSPSGFSVHGAQVAHTDEPAKLERLARYISRAPFVLGKMELLADGRVRVETPPDPRSGQTSIVLDALEFVHRVTTQIPDARRHLIRYYGAYSHRSRGARRAREAAAAEGGSDSTGGVDSADVHGSDSAADTAAETAAEPTSRSRASWARLIRRIYEVDPLLCPRCQGPLALISVLVDPRVVDAILRHLDVSDEPLTLHARDPPAA